MALETFPAKRLLTPTGGSGEDFFRTDWNMNLYRGCDHGCVYCDSRSVCYHIERFSTVRVKENALDMLRTELLGKRRAGVVGMGAASDPYNSFEKDELITRGALELFARYGFGTGFSTKSDMVARDAELLARIGASMPVRVAFSITTADDGLAAFIEPGAPRSSARFAAMARLASAGVFTGTWMNPMLPFMTDTADNVRQIARRTRECGGRFVICHFAVTLREGDREYFYAALDKSAKYKQLKKRYSDAFGLAYMCTSPDAEALYAVLREECERLGLHCGFRALNDELDARAPSQLSLF